MQHSPWVCWKLSAIAALVWSSCPAVALYAATLTFSDFSSTAGLQLNGDAAVVDTADGKVLRIVPSDLYRTGSFFSQSQVNASTFSTTFAFRITDTRTSGADGLVFVIQPVSSSIGSTGGGMGYEGITPSVGVEFDTWQNTWDADGNHIGIDVNGNVTSLETVVPSLSLEDGNIWQAWIDYDGTTLEVRAAESPDRPADPLLSRVIDIPAILGGNIGYIGFTAATGAAYEDHDILNWTYHDAFVPEPATGLIALMGCGLFGAMLPRRGKRPA